MAATVARSNPTKDVDAAAIAPDRVVHLEIRPGMFHAFLATLAEGGALVKCYNGSVTLVSPGATHETHGHRLPSLILAVCAVLKIALTPLGSTIQVLPAGTGDSGHEPDESYYVQSHGKAAEGQVPDLAIEVVVSNPAVKVLAVGALLRIPEIWVLDVPRRRPTFFQLIRRGKHRGAYQPRPRGLAFSFLNSSEVLKRRDDPEKDAVAFHENCRAWAKEVLIARVRRDGERDA